MLPTEQAQFFEIIGHALAAYGKYPEKRELEAWWRECRSLTLEALEAALKAHKADQDRGERAPKPADISRRMKAGDRDAQRCAATDPNGQCAYPGIFSDGTQGEGSWYCPLHRSDRVGPEASRRIDYSQSMPWDEFRAKQIAKRLAESQRAPAVIATAHTIAMRHRNRPWQTGLAEMIPDKLQGEAA